MIPNADPQLTLNCPTCGSRLRYGATTAPPEREADQPRGDFHHYVCTKPACTRFWKFGPGTSLIADPLQLAADAQQTRH